MICIVLLMLIANIVAYFKSKKGKKGKYYNDDKFVIFFFTTLVSFMISLSVIMVISAVICTTDYYKNKVYEWEWRERPIVALRTQDAIKGTIHGNFLGFVGDIEGTNYYRYLVKNSNGVIVVRKTEYPNIKIGEIPMERTQMVYHKNPWYSTKWVLFDPNDDYEGYTVIVVPEHTITQKFEIKP